MTLQPRSTPDGFSLLTGAGGDLFLACGDEFASSYAVRVVSGDTFDIARRVPTDALAALNGVEASAVVWHLGISNNRTDAYRIVVHRPFGAILEF